MATYRLKRFSASIKEKIFFLGLNGEAITGAEVLDRKKADGGSMKAALDNVKLDKGIATETAESARAATRAANQANAAGVKSAAMRARTAGYNAGMKAGMQNGAASVGFKQGAMNSWSRMGTMGKVGVGAGAALGVGLMAKGLFGGKKKED